MLRSSIILAVLAIGCGDDSSPRVGECTTPDDCPAGHSCVDNACVSRDGGPTPEVDSGLTGCSNDAACDDGVSCTVDRCDTGTRTCSHTPDHALCPTGSLCAGAAGCLPGRICTTAAECDDSVFCNGTEACVAERCAPGTAVDCDDGIACSADVCDEGAGECLHLALDERCDDGMHCNGIESCDAETGCVTGTAPACDDGLDCTTDACDESIDACVAPPGPGRCVIDGGCHLDGATDGGDFCRTCDAATSPTAWVVSCTGSTGDDTFEDFRAGRLGRSAANLYVHASGNVQSVHRSDLDRDGFPDALQVNYYNGTTRRVNSSIHRGSATGLDPARADRIDLPTIGALASATADLDADGYVDLVFAQHHDDVDYTLDSYVYWGSASGWSATDRTDLPTLGAYAVEVADFDRDGWLDLVFANYFDGTRYNTSSYLYWGSPAGFSATDRTALPTEGSLDLCVADLDGDEQLELIAVGYYNCATGGCGAAGYTSARLRIFRGSAAGPDPAMLTHVPSLGGRGCAVADIDRDGDLDLLLTNHYNGTTGLVDSRILWGDPALPFDVARSNAFPTSWASRGSIADIDGNGWLDVAVPQAYNGSTYSTSSRVYFRDATGTTLTEFYPTIGAYDVELLDWNGDDRIDLFWSGHYDGTRYLVENRYYAGGRPRPATTGAVVFPSVGTLGLRSHDFGHTWDRGWVESFTSRPLDLGDGRSASWLGVRAAVPAGTALRFQLRSAADEAALATTPWRGPTGATDFYTTWPVRVSTVHAGHRFVQYRAELELRNAADSPVLDRVAIHFL